MAGQPARVDRADLGGGAVIAAEYLEARDAASLLDLEGALIRFAQRRDFATVSAVVVVDQPDGEATFVSVGNIPEAFYAAHKNRDNSRRDPVLQAVKHQTLPVVWDQNTYVKAGASDLWEEQAPFGFHQGIGLAMHASGLHYLLGVNGPGRLPGSVDALTSLVAELQLMAVYSHDAALRLIRVPEPEEDSVSLTARERDVLTWTLEDKSAWVVGKLLSISEHTVAFHLKNAMRKLGCATKHSAAAKAVRLGLITPPRR
jgi:DNA-binding CsgD family transcriptional regulator